MDIHLFIYMSREGQQSALVAGSSVVFVICLGVVTGVLGLCAIL